MIIKITGHITDIFPTESFGNFEKRVAWVAEVSGDRYPNTYALEFQQNDVNQLDHVSPGDLVECKVDVKGKKWEKGGKSGVINVLKCFDIIRQAAGPKFVPSTRNQTGGIPRKTPPPGNSPSGHPDRWQSSKKDLED
jgi:hypothetical protein